MLPIEKAFEDLEGIKNIVSTFDSSTFELSEDPNCEGIKQITYNGILKYDTFPLADMVKNILELGKTSMKVAIEIEFAVNLNRGYPKKPEFSVLQIRPIIEGFEDDEDLATSALAALGAGKFGEILGGSKKSPEGGFNLSEEVELGKGGIKPELAMNLENGQLFIPAGASVRVDGPDRPDRGPRGFRSSRGRAEKGRLPYLHRL